MGSRFVGSGMAAGTKLTRAYLLMKLRGGLFRTRYGGGWHGI